MVFEAEGTAGDDDDPAAAPDGPAGPDEDEDETGAADPDRAGRAARVTTGLDTAALELDDAAADGFNTIFAGEGCAADAVGAAAAGAAAGFDTIADCPLPPARILMVVPAGERVDDIGCDERTICRVRTKSPTANVRPLVNKIRTSVAKHS